MKDFNKKENKIVVVHYGNIMLYPPVINLVENLINNDYSVTLMAGNTKKLPDFVLKSSNLQIIDFPIIASKKIIKRLQRRFLIGHYYKDALRKIMDPGDIVWTTTDSTVRALNTALLKYKHIMQLMELDDFFPLFDGAKLLKFNLEKYGKHAWKIVVPEINRAYIQKVKWRLKETPCILPNKPYYLSPGEMDDSVIRAIEIIEKDPRKKIMYLGVLSVDRNLEPFAKAVEKMGEDYALYTLGNVPNSEQEKFNQFLAKHPQVFYLGFFNPPNHLHFLKYAYVGLTPYSTDFKSIFISPLNVLYCAPNKIYEYAGYGIPMLGTDVLGLKIPFEQYGIGFCCINLEPETIAKGLKYIDINHEKMRQNCLRFYEDTDLDKILASIING
ncbi:hypothetical protein [uncultured Dubosiella sp.]|uniref:hypothetical protein n=1 Tax=uncultured Dubosiella sp. TaxID=1937011 RepID=UPI0025B5A5C6|nr:hypothetical protein [uncultured Dubosiella sp.]